MSTTTLPTYDIFIDGEFVSPAEDRYLDSINPATGKAWYQVASAGAADVDRAVRAARAALVSPAWAGLTPSARGRLLRRVADGLAARAEDLAMLETNDNGKLIRDTRALYGNLPIIWEYFAGWADKVGGEVVPTVGTNLTYLRREPIGVVAAIVPWNAPINLASHKIAAALAMGNTVVVKPSEITSAGILEMMKILDEAGVPRGVVNVVTGTGADVGQALVAHPGVDLIAFTGGTSTGTAIAKKAAERHVPVLLELGGKSPNIVFDDANTSNAANGIISGIFAAGGQACTAGSRVYLHNAVYDEVLDKVKERMSGIRLGDPLAAETEIGPVAYEAHMNRILDYIRIGQEEGADLTFGGNRVSEGDLASGFYVAPTIFENVTSEMRITREEIFGPVLSVIRFDTEEEVVRQANDSAFGLVAGVWTQNVNRAHRIAHQLDAGTVWVNTYRALSPLAPFGGFKSSGHGKEGGEYGVLEMTRLKTVWVNLSEAPTADPFVIQK
ncbi:aldehyde dehydrogenase [Microbacterium sp. X-17]|uniref:aldehyde dehydrogenase n=1 Tax=Microbacterium sp. X-17 TaxID=3144404 RepID=UPI0031F5D2D4